MLWNLSLCHPNVNDTEHAGYINRALVISIKLKLWILESEQKKRILSHSMATLLIWCNILVHWLFLSAHNSAAFVLFSDVLFDFNPLSIFRRERASYQDKSAQFRRGGGQELQYGGA